MIALLIESAGRSLLLLLPILAFVRLLRVRNAHSELIALQAGLCAALLMPLLSQIRLMPLPVDATIAASFLSATAVTDSSPSWVHVTSAAYVAYMGVALMLLARLAIGLFGAWRMWRAATRSTEQQFAGLPVRIGAHINAPLTIGSTILLPADCLTWNPFKLRAALAHELGHVRNGDLYWHVAALVHRAIFWINPLAWWLPKRMAELTELLRDSAAVQAVNDSVEYAQVLLDFSRKPSAVLAMRMATPSDVTSRIEWLLNNHSLPASSQRKAVTIAAVVATATLAACASIKDVVAPPRFNAVMKLPFPEYIDSEKQAGHEGVVYLAVLVDQSGKVVKTKVKKSSGFEALDRSAETTALAQWRLIPGTKNGKPVEQWVTVPVVFKLSKAEARPAA